MLMILSPSKTLDCSNPPGHHPNSSQPELLAHSKKLIALLRQQSPADLTILMSISDKLAVLNAERFHSWHTPFTQDNAKPALMAFMGDVYEGLDATTLTPQQQHYLQQRLSILSGLYGVLRPLDLIQPYRLEMGTRLANSYGRDLYAFWGGRITDCIKRAFKKLDSKELVNLASGEYFKTVHAEHLPARLITPIFQDCKMGQYKLISFYAKRARGLMVRWAALHSITAAEDLKDFSSEGYRFTPQVSDADRWVFRRKERI